MSEPGDQELAGDSPPDETSTSGEPAAIEENEPAGSRLTPPSTTSLEQRETTRTWLAWTLVISVVGLAVVGAVGWLLYGDDVDRMQTFATVFSPIVALVGPVLGFYFGSKD